MKKILIIMFCIYSTIVASGDMKKCEEIHNQADKLAIEEKNKQGASSMHMITSATTSDAYRRNYEQCKKDIEIDEQAKDKSFKKSNTDSMKNHKN